MSDRQVTEEEANEAFAEAIHAVLRRSVSEDVTDIDDDQQDPGSSDGGARTPAPTAQNPDELLAETIKNRLHYGKGDF